MLNAMLGARLRIAWFALIIVGLGLVLWLASSDATRAGEAYREHGEPPEALADNHHIGQIVLLRLDQLVGIRFWLNPPAQRGAGTIALRVRSLEQKQDLATVELPVAELSADGPTTFSLPALAAPPLQINRRETLELMLMTRGVDQSDPIQVGVGKNGYGYGLMIRDGKEIPRSDLAFETLYSARLLDGIFPITAIASARPGIFGWPPLYAILAYGVMVILGRFVYQLLRSAFYASL